MHAAEPGNSCSESSYRSAHKSEIKTQNDGWNSSETLIPRIPDLYVARRDYLTEEVGQLSIMKGDCLTISRKSEDRDWTEATNQLGEIGLVPSSYIAKLDSLEEHSWFYGPITRDEAELRLTSGMNGSFLIRESESTYAISLHFSGRVFHYIIHSDSSKFYIAPESKFETIAQLVAHHSKLSDGLCTLLRYPVPNPTKGALNSWELNRSDIEIGQGLGGGLYGAVYKALLKGNTIVAVKKFRVRYKHMYIHVLLKWSFMFLASLQIVGKQQL